MAYYTAPGAVPSRAWARQRRQAILSRRPPRPEIMTTRAVIGLGAMPDCWSDTEVDACMESYAESGGETGVAWCQKFMTDDAYADRVMNELDDCPSEGTAKWLMPLGIGIGVITIAGIWFLSRRKKT